MTYEEMKYEVAYIITKRLKYHICFLIGDNMTGKTDIAELVNQLDPSIIVLDNYKGKYNDLPQNGKVLVITHNPYILKSAHYTDKVISIYRNTIYMITDIEDDNHVDSLFYYQNEENHNLHFLLGKLLNNATQGCWSKLNDEFLELYKKEKEEIKKSDELIFNEIDYWKKSEGLLYD